MASDATPIHVFGTSTAKRVDGDVALVRAPTWRAAQGEIPDTTADRDDPRIVADGSLEGLRLDPGGDYPELVYLGTWSETSATVEDVAASGTNPVVSLIPYDDEDLRAIASDLRETSQAAEEPSAPGQDNSREPGYTNPYEEKIAGETEVTFQCGVAAAESIDDDAAEACAHEPEPVELDEPASIDDDGKVHLPGRPAVCRECGNGHSFRFNGLLVSFT